MKRRQAIAFETFLTGAVYVPGASGALTTLQLHPAQRAFAQAIDAIDPQTRRRTYRRFLLSWPKKTGKTETIAALAVWACTSDVANGADREVYLVATDYEQAAVAFSRAVRQFERNPQLAKQTRITAREIIFREVVTDPKTGGKYHQLHVIRAVPRDVRGLHGVNPSCLIIDEAWTMDDYDVIEALAQSPVRESPITVFAGYAGLRSQARRGNPFWDLWQASIAGSDPGLFGSILTGPDAWRQVPWLTEAWVTDMQAQFATCPSKFQRLVLNQWAQSEHSLITTAELQDALIDAAEPEYGERGVTYSMALDLGLSHDWTALVVAHVDGMTGRVVPDVVKTWRGTPAEPVSLAAVEEAVVTLARRFKPRRIVVDQWQAGYLVERLRARQVEHVKLVTVEQAKLDRLVTLLKHLFASRAIAIPKRELALREQLEWLETEEAGARNRRRDRIRFVPGGDDGAAARDDMVIALSLAAEVLEGEAGRATLPPMRTCGWGQATGQPVECFLWNNGLGFFPPYNAPGCAECPGLAGLRRMYDEHVTRGADPMPGGIRQFLVERVKLNDYCNERRYRQWEARQNF